MFRLTSLCGRDRKSPQGDTDITGRSSTEDHKDQKSRDMSVADRHTPDPVCGRETDLNIWKYNTQNNSEVSNTSTCISPRKLSSKAYIPTPYSRPVTPVSEAEPEDVKTTTNEEEISMYNPIVAPIPPKVTKHFAPVPYHRGYASYSPVHWQSPIDVGVRELDDMITVSPEETYIEDIVTQRLPGMFTSNDLCVGTSPVPLASDTISQTFVDNERLILDPSNKVTAGESVSETKKDCIESVTAKQGQLSCEVEMENEIKMKMNRRKEQLMQMTSYQKPQNPGEQKEADKKSSKTTPRKAKQNKWLKAGRAKKSSIKEKPPSEDCKEMQKLKQKFDEHLKEKEKFDKMIEKREQDIEEQINEMDEILASIQEERSGVENVAKEFADTMKTYTNFRDEANRARVHHVEQEISSDIVYEENGELKEHVRELYDQINEIKERRAIGIDGLRKDSEEIKCTAENLKEMNNEDEIEIKSKVEEFNRLKMVMIDEGISYISKRRPVQESHWDANFPKARICISPPLKANSIHSSALKIEMCDMENVTPDIAKPRLKRRFESDRISQSIYEEDIASNTNKTYETATNKTVQNYKITETEGSYEQCDNRTDDIIQSAKCPYVIDLENASRNGFGYKSPISELTKPKRQTSAIEQVRLPDARTSDCKIPKPVVQPYGSASRDGDRFMVSKSSSLAVIENKRYKRDEFVPEGQRHVTKPTIDFLDAETELRKLKKKISDRKNGLSDQSANIEYERRDNVNGRYVIDLENASGNGFGYEDKSPIRELAKPKRQMSAIEQVRLPDARTSDCKIPKPVVQPYGSASRDGDRFMISKSSSLAVIENKRYKRDEFVPEGQRHVTKPTMDFLDAETELRKLKKKISDRQNGLSDHSANIEYERRDNVNGHYSSSDKPVKQLEEQPSTTRKKWKEVKSKIDTGLKNRPNNKAISKTVKSVHSDAMTDTSLARKDTKRRQNGCIKAPGNDTKPRVKSKKLELPPLKNTKRTTKNVNDMPRSSTSFSDKTPLPKIQPANRQRKDERPKLPPVPKIQTGSDSLLKTSNKRRTDTRSSRFSAPLPPISKADSKCNKKQDLPLTENGTSHRSKARTRRLPPIVPSQNQSAQSTPIKKKPEAMWISFSPSPPPNGERNGRAQNSSREKDKKRVSSGRA